MIQVRGSLAKWEQLYHPMPKKGKYHLPASVPAEGIKTFVPTCSKPCPCWVYANHTHSQTQDFTHAALITILPALTAQLQMLFSSRMGYKLLIIFNGFNYIWYVTNQFWITFIFLVWWQATLAIIWVFSFSFIWKKKLIIHQIAYILFRLK